MDLTDNNLALSSETGKLGVMHIKRIWSHAIDERADSTIDRKEERQLDGLVIDALGLGHHQIWRYLYQYGSTFEEFEEWILKIAGTPDKRLVERLNSEITGNFPNSHIRQWLESIEALDPVLSEADLEFWDENGYIVLKNAVDPGESAAAEKAVWDYLGADPKDRASWYETDRDGIMVELIQHEAFERNRRAPRIHKAFAQLYGTPDLWVTADRCSFHVPERDDAVFPGPDLHWDMDLAQPFSFRTQGILYLSDTLPEQGALTVVPGFHRCLEAWLANLGHGKNPHDEDLHALGSLPIGGNGGDLVIWHQALPHGSRSNLEERPRIAQYINMYPGRSNKKF